MKLRPWIGSKSTPGVAATCAFSSMRPANSKLSEVKIRYISVEVKGAVGRQEPGEAGLRQSLDQDAAVLLIAALESLPSPRALEGRFGRICDNVGTEIDRFCCSRSIGRTKGSGHHHPADRQPVMQKYFENELITSACGESSAAVTAGNA